ASEDASAFTAENLEQFDAIIFLNTTGNILNAAQQTAFEEFIQSGGGYVGIHAASDTEYDWPWYEGLVGAYFQNHPPGTSSADIKVSDRVHPSTAGLPHSWTRTDEWYNFRMNPRGNVHVLATVDETSYAGGSMGFDHPVTWCHEYDGGRAWYTALGHTSASYAEPLFQEHVLGGIYYAVREVTGPFEATVDDNFEVSIIDNNPVSPIALAVLPDSRVLFLERAGKVKLYEPATGALTTAANFNVDANREDGLLGIVLDPDFRTNRFLYLFYSPAGGAPRQYVSRFEFRDGEIDKSSEVIMMTIPVQRQDCCHSGGDLEFDTEGNLYISVGDNTNPFQSDGYTPIDERPGRQNFDAQGTSSNTQDLRGKILRIKPMPDGTYTIPSDNLFSDPNEGLPEIYAMGVRNPFRMTVSPDGYLYFGDVGPDAQTDNGNRGPKGHDEFNRTQEAGHFGWPYCIANNLHYHDYNFASGQQSGPFNCAAPTNNSPNNTGANTLPPAQGAWMWYNKDNSALFPGLNGPGGRTAMAGAVYQYNPDSTLEDKFPPYYQNSVFIYEWSRNWIREIKLDNAGDIVAINPFLTSLSLNRPIDMDF
ncbi:MAG: ThuA domain-containing protein, partial [Bacteroidota bacterium]